MSNEAWQYTSRGPLSETIKRTAKPIPTPQDDEIVVEVKAVGLNPVEEQVAQSSDRLLKFIKAEPMGTPFVPCEDYAGIVHAVGSGVTKWKVGDEVMGVKLEGWDGNGTLQAYTTVKASGAITSKPNDLPWEQAAALPLVYATVYTALVRHGRLPFTTNLTERARSVLILGGSSGTGSAAIQLAKKMGLNIVTTCSGKNVDLVKQLGADEVIDYTKQHVPEDVLMSKYAPYAVVLDCVGGTDLIPYLDNLLLNDSDAQHLGIYVTIVGDKTSRSAMGGAVTNWYYPSQAIRSLRGLLTDYIPNFIPLKSLVAGPRYACIMLEGDPAILDTIPEFLESAQEPFIDEVMEFADAPRAFRRLESGRARGKVVVKL